jgi:RNA polymerase sigma-70 factor (ECF subfamily)
MEDSPELLEAVKRLDKKALEQVFDEYSHAIYNYALRLCQDPVQADHIVGDTFSRLLDQLAAGKGPRKNLRSYLYQTAYHLFVDQSRDRQRMAPIEIVDFISSELHSMQSVVENRAIMDVVMLAINNDLTDEQRHVIILRFLEGLSLKETAKIVGKNVDSVKAVQSRGMAKLRKLLANIENGLKDDEL